jgi:hypothetical protein
MSEGSSDSGFCAKDSEDQQTSRIKKEKWRIGKDKKSTQKVLLFLEKKGFNFSRFSFS